MAADAVTDNQTTDDAPSADVQRDSAQRHSAQRDSVQRHSVQRDSAQRHSGVRRGAAWATTALAALLVLFALIAPNRISHFTPGAFLRIPVEALVGVALLLVLPPRGRRITAVVVGVLLGLLMIVKIVDMGFYTVLNRPFDLVLDGSLFGNGLDFLTAAYGRVGATVAVILAVVAVVAVLVFMTLAVRRLTRLVAQHRTGAIRVSAVLAAVWGVCALLGVQLVAGVPVASTSAATLVYDHARQADAGLRDRPAFATQAAADAFHDTPGDKMLTALRGKDVVLTVVESYGRSAVQDPKVAAMLDAGTKRLATAGFAARSAYLASPVFGANSWLAHATLLSGLWVDNQQRHDTLVKTDRLTLSGAFQRAGWRTVAVMPGTNGEWSEAKFFGIDQVYAGKDLGYRGPNFSWAAMPDQYTYSAFQRLEYGKPDHAPLFAEIVTVSSHAPWEPIPRFLSWSELGDGSVFSSGAAKGDQPEAILKMDPALVRANYARSIEYSLNSLISYVETYGKDNMVLVFLGDHQPSPVVTGDGAPHDVPVTIVARDRTVLDRISGWGWHEGLQPGPQAPVWRMDAFRDRFLTAFGPRA